MKTRDEEPFMVQQANTERLKNSAIPHMQRLLNNYEQLSNQRIKMPG
jgi:hypothetical protein